MQNSQRAAYDGSTPIDWRAGTQGGPFTMDAGGGESHLQFLGLGASTSASLTGSANAATTPTGSMAPLNPSVPFAFPLSSSFPAQMPPQWATAALAAGSPAVGAPSSVGAYNPYAMGYGYTAAGCPSSLPPNYHLAQMASAAAQTDSNLFALHMSLEQQAQVQARMGSSPAGSPAPLSNYSQMSSSLPAASFSMGPPPNPSSVGPARRNSKHNSGRSAGGPGGKTPRQRQATLPLSVSATTTPLGSPQSQPGAYFPPTLTRPLPPMPKRPNGNGSSSAMSSAHPSPLASPRTGNPGVPAPLHPLTASIMSAAAAVNAARTHSASSSAAASPSQPVTDTPRSSVPPVDFDFSSLEHDLDRFSADANNMEGGGFASAAAAAMASVGSNRRSQKSVAGAYGVGGYGSPSPLHSAGSALEGADGVRSPKAIVDVLSESVTFPPRSPGPSAAPSPIDFSAFLAGSPADSSSGTAAGTGVAKPSPLGSGSGAGDFESPASSTIIDEDGAEMLSRKDPIAAQVWRMFNKAKNTLPNGARMENLTWRLMSMTLKKRREETAAAAAAATATALSSTLSDEQKSGAGSLGAIENDQEQEATLRQAMEQELQRQERIRRAKAEEEAEAAEIAAEAENGLQELRTRSDSIRGNKSSAMSSHPPTVPEEEEDRGRRRRGGPGGSSGTKSASASASPEAAAEEE